MLPRSQNLDDKPRMQAWLSNDTPATRTFEKVVKYLRFHYTGNNQGYTDTIDYRFNNSREGGYIVVNRGGVGFTIVRIAYSNKSISIDNENLSEDDFKRIANFLIKNKVNSFNFSYNYNIQLEKEVEELLKLSPQNLLKKIKDCSYPPIPEKISITTIGFKRNPYIIAQRLSLANGICGDCEEDAPFKRRNTGEPYLEVHHVKPLSEGGEDTLDNTIALCPNCHRQKHFG